MQLHNSISHRLRQLACHNSTNTSADNTALSWARGLFAIWLLGLPGGGLLGGLELLVFIALAVLPLLYRRLRQQAILLQHYQDVIQAAPFAISIYDHKDRLVEANARYLMLHQKAFAKNPNIQSYRELLEASVEEFASPHSTQAWLEERLIAHHQGSGTPIDRHYTDDLWLRVSKHKTPRQSTISFGIDITELKHRENHLEDSEKRYQALAQVAPVGIWQIDEQGKTLCVNTTLLNLFNVTNQADFEKNLPLQQLQLEQNKQLLSVEASQARLLRGKNAFTYEAVACFIHDAARPVPSDKTLVISRSKLLEDSQGQCSYIICIVDISKHKQAELDIRYLAEHDALTGLLNRNMLRLKLHQIMVKKEQFALVLLNLDHFKAVNNSLGHSIGDQLIKEVAYRIKKQLREHDFACRLGGDEYAVILPGISNLKMAHDIVARLYLGFQTPVIIDQQLIPLSASAGIALYPEHGNHSQALIQHADIALHHQKNLGRGSFTIFETALATNLQAGKLLQQDLRRALQEGDELCVHYQPQFQLQTGQITGVEALVRWHNKRTQQWVAPIDFIPLAEQLGLIYSIDKFVLNTAARQVHAWHQQGFSALVLASNLSGVHFKNDNLRNMVDEALASSHLDPSCLELEITESLFLSEQSHASEQLKQLRDRGIRVAIDDFGTGYSNLGYLNNLPVDCLKIDRSFIDKFEKNDYHRAIVTFVIALGENLKLDIVAEGIETQTQLEKLKNLNCGFGQGYLFSPPKSAAAITEQLNKNVVTHNNWKIPSHDHQQSSFKH